MIPREGVESSLSSLIISPAPSASVIPREGVESRGARFLQRLLNRVIPREGVERNVVVNSLTFTFTSVIPREGVESYFDKTGLGNVIGDPERGS